MAKLSSLLILVAVSAVARAETTDELYGKVAQEVERLRAVKRSADVNTLEAPILVQPKPGDVAARMRFEELSQVASGDRVASAMIVQRTRLRQLFEELKRGKLSEKQFADVSRLRDLLGDFRKISETQLMSMPLPSDPDAKRKQGKAGVELNSLGSALTARGPNTPDGHEDLGKKAQNVLGQGWNTAVASANVAVTELNRNGERDVRKRELQNIEKLERDVTDFYLNLKRSIENEREGKNLAKINEHRILHQYDNAPGIDDLDKPKAHTAQE